MNLAELSRYKNSVPFSADLNSWIENYVYSLLDSGSISGVDYFENDEYDTFEAILGHYKATNRVAIWSGASDNNIFGSSEINLLFRVWHDYIHITNNLNFDAINEIKVAKIQSAQLPFNMLEEKLLIEADIIGQVLYYLEYNEFPIDQRKFTIDFLTYGTITDKF